MANPVRWIQGRAIISGANGLKILKTQCFFSEYLPALRICSGSKSMPFCTLRVVTLKLQQRSWVPWRICDLRGKRHLRRTPCALHPVDDWYSLRWSTSKNNWGIKYPLASDMERCAHYGTWPRNLCELGRQNSTASFVNMVVFQAHCTPTIHSPPEEHSCGAHLEVTLHHLVDICSYTPNANQNYTLCGIYISTRERNISLPVGGGLFQSCIFALFSPLNLGSACPFPTCSCV